LLSQYSNEAMSYSRSITEYQKITPTKDYLQKHRNLPSYTDKNTWNSLSRAEFTVENSETS